MTITNNPFRGTDTLVDCPVCDNQFWQRPQGTPLTCGYACGQMLRATQRPKLSPRETQVQELLALGMSTKRIGEELGLTTGSIKNVVTIINRKLSPSRS